MPTQRLHEGSPHSPPACSTISRSPSASAWRRTDCDPGTTSSRTPGATWPCRRMAAASRRSSIRELVHDPTNTTSTRTAFMASPGRRPMSDRASSSAARRAGCCAVAGSGTVAPMPTAMSGSVPKVTMGWTVEASNLSSVSNRACGSLRSCSQACAARSHCSSVGAKGRPCRYFNVTSSGATRAALAPNSAPMLHRVMRCSMPSVATALPVNSITWPAATLLPKRASMASTRSLALTPGDKAPSMRMRMDFALR